MWTIDDNQYYSNRTARYFTYENPRDFGLNSVDMEIEALKSALAISMVTGRLLILPTFRCCSRNCRAMKPGSRVHVVIDIPASTNTSRVVSSSTECSDPRHHCSLLSVLRLSKFDRVFGSRYREHTFLSNRLVPDVIKLGISPFSIFINTSDAPPPSGGNVTVVTPANRDRGATVSEVVRWFDERRDETVIRFHSLYGTTIDWSSDKALNFKLKRYFQVGFECSEYEQWEADQLDLAKMWPENKIN